MELKKNKLLSLSPAFFLRIFAPKAAPYFLFIDGTLYLILFHCMIRRVFCAILCYNMNCFVSVRDGDTVKHYRIRQLDQGGYYIARRTTFRTLPDMVTHYTRDADGLCVNLRKPCVRVSLLLQNIEPIKILSCCAWEIWILFGWTWETNFNFYLNLVLH